MFFVCFCLKLYNEGEAVLVESESGDMLWDAEVIGVARQKDGIAYRVKYNGWDSRYDEWVSAPRVVDPSDHNRDVQKEMIEDAINAKKELPALLENLEAASYLQARDRVRGNSFLPDFHRIAYSPPNASSNDRIFATMKAALLAIEAALPVGSVDNTEQGDWSKEFAAQWRSKVLQADGPWDLMRCVFILEESISEEWIRPDLFQLRSGLPGRAKALEEASPSSLAIRLILLDRSLLFDHVDKKKFKPTKSKR